jgi:hypothetical protein
LHLQCFLPDEVRICAFWDPRLYSRLIRPRTLDCSLSSTFDLLIDLPRLPNAYWQEYTTKVVAASSHDLTPKFLHQKQSKPHSG